MFKCSIAVLAFMFIAANQSSSFADERASPPKQYLLHVGYYEGQPYHNDGSPKHSAAAICDALKAHQLHNISEPDVLLVENKECHVSIGGTIEAASKNVDYGTNLDAIARSNPNGTIELDFVAEHSWLAPVEASDLGDKATRVSAEKLCGKVIMRPNVMYRVSAAKRGSDEIWWEFWIESEQMKLPNAK